MMALLYSLGGGALCILVTLALAKILRRNQMWIASVAGAIAHNIGQLTVAAAVMQTRAVFAYLPALLISGVITGAFTGLAVQLLTDRLSKQ
jgi:heptaprenyl diphosphate synthase